MSTLLNSLAFNEASVETSSADPSQSTSILKTKCRLARCWPLALGASAGAVSGRK